MSAVLARFLIFVLSRTVTYRDNDWSTDRSGNGSSHILTGIYYVRRRKESGALDRHGIQPCEIFITLLMIFSVSTHSVCVIRLCRGMTIIAFVS